MRTSLSKIKQTEAFLTDKLVPEEALFFQARMLTEPVLRWDVILQAKVYALLKIYHRKKIKKKLEQLHRDIFQDPSKISFQATIHQFFNNQS